MSNAGHFTLLIARETSAGGNTYDVAIQGTAALRLIDYTSLRARAGWDCQRFRPYGFAGFVVGRADYSRTSLVQGVENPLGPNPVPFAYANSDGQNSALMYGFSVGGGMDVAVTANLFLRGEFEYVRFAPLADMTVSLMSGRIGAGIKF